MTENETAKETMPIGRPNIYVQSLTFNDGTTLPVNKNDIVVFVGPNNVGKSQTLKEIFALSEGDVETKLLAEATFTTDATFPISKWFAQTFVCHVQNNGNRIYSGLGFQFYEHVGAMSIREQRPSHLTAALFCKLQTESRLSISNPPEQIDYGETPRHPIHILQHDDDLRKKVSSYFHDAFDTCLIPFIHFGKHIPLVLGSNLSLVEAPPDEIEREAKVADVLRTYPHLEAQGDGMRSFAGIMLYLVMNHYNAFLIDEPESFLHPPQARLMGEIVGDLLSDEQQSFVSTHSIHFIQGLLEKCPKRVKVVRITRTGNKNTFSILDQTRILELSKDPFLKYSNVLEGLFYKNVVLCEADADCMFYSMINGASDMKGAKSADTLFIHCGGKHRMASVARNLCDLNVDFRVIPDFDVFNDKNMLKNLVEACGGTWSEFERDFNILSASVQQRVKQDTPGKELLAKISDVFASNPSEPVSKSKKDTIRKLLDETKTEWERLKESGVFGVSSGDAQGACRRLLEHLTTIRIHVVSCGELERFVPDCGDHGPPWIQNVLDTYPDLSNPVFAKAKDFVKSWNL